MAFLVVTAVGVLSTPGRNKYGTEKFVNKKFIFYRIDMCFIMDEG